MTSLLCGGNTTLWELFKKVEPDAGKYEILEIVRVFNPAHIYQAALWFTYVEKKDVLPIDKLPPLPARH